MEWKAINAPIFDKPMVGRGSLSQRVLADYREGSQCPKGLNDVMQCPTVSQG